MKHPFYDLALLIDLKIKCVIHDPWEKIYRYQYFGIDAFRHSASNWNSWTRDCPK